jgi:hypothetical protein
VGFPTPTFNVVVNCWRNAAWNASFPPIVPAPSLTFNGNLQMGDKVAGGAIQTGYMYLAVPKLTDIRDGIKEVNPPAAAPNDVVEVPAGSGRFYAVVWVDDVGKGFPNEYRNALIGVVRGVGLVPQLPLWPTPYP